MNKHISLKMDDTLLKSDKWILQKHIESSTKEEIAKKQINHTCEISVHHVPFVSEAGTGSIVQPYVHINRKADFNVMIYVLKGKMEVIEDGITYELTPGTLFYLKNGVQHWGEKSFEINTSWCYAHFYTNPITQDMTSFNERLIQDKDDKWELENVNFYLRIPKVLHLPLGNSIEKKIIELSKLQGLANIVKRNIKMWEIILESYDYVNNNEVKSNEDLLIQSIISFIGEHYNKKFSMMDVEEKMKLTYKYIGTLFKKRTGMTIKSYQLKLRIEKSVILLGETQMSISEIADVVGFGDVYYFSNVFKRKKGISPSMFRKEYQPKI